VAGAGHVRIYPAMCSVCPSSLFLSPLNLNPRDEKFVNVQPFHFRVTLSVSQKIKQEFGGFPRPTALGSQVVLFGLRMSANTPVKPSEWNGLFLGDDIFKEFFADCGFESSLHEQMFSPEFNSFGAQNTMKTAFPPASSFPSGFQAGEKSSFSSRSFGRPVGGAGNNFTSKSVTRKTVNGVTSTITTEKDREGNETVTTETSDGQKTVMVNGVLRITQ